MGGPRVGLGWASGAAEWTAGALGTVEWRMIICQVTGTVVATEKVEGLEGFKLLVVQPLSLELEPEGGTFLAVDQVDAGEGDRVLVTKEGGSARQLTGRKTSPVQSVIVGVIDHIEIESDS